MVHGRRVHFSEVSCTWLMLRGTIAREQIHEWRKDFSLLELDDRQFDEYLRKAEGIVGQICDHSNERGREFSDV